MSTYPEFVTEEPLPFGLTALPAVEVFLDAETDAASACHVPVEVIVHELPSSFWEGLADCDHGRVVDLDAALESPPPDDE